MSDVTDRLDALEAKMAKLATLTVADLPLAALQRKLEQDWQPHAEDILAPGSITADLLGVCRGQATATGGGTPTATVAVTDGFGTTAKLAVAIQHVGGTFVGDVVVCGVSATAATTTTFRVDTRNGGNITAAQTVLIDYWIWRA